MTLRLTETAKAWGNPDFEIVLKREIECLDGAQLPLQQGLSTGSYAIDGKLDVIINSVSERDNAIRVTAGIFYKGIIAGCSCADDPTPVDEHNEYCEVRLDINKTTGDTTVTLA